jgi:hypothetical protein
MKPLILVLVLAAAGCVSVPRQGRGDERPREDTSADRDAKATVRESFDQLHNAWLEGDAMASLGTMSVQGISDWVLERSRDKSDTDWPKRVAALDAVRKIDLEQWIRANKGIVIPFVRERSVPLTETLLVSQWLVDTWKHYFEIEKEAMSINARELEVSEVYVEGTTASVFVKSGKSPAMMYAMVQEGGHWKFDYDVRPATRNK